MDADFITIGGWRVHYTYIVRCSLYAHTALAMTGQVGWAYGGGVSSAQCISLFGIVAFKQGHGLPQARTPS